MNTEIAPYLALVAAVAATAIVAYRLGYRHGNDTGWECGYFAHKKLNDETRIRLRNSAGQFAQPSQNALQTHRPPSASSRSN